MLSLNTTGVQKELLTPAASGALEIYLVTIAPGGSSGPELYTHKGEEGGYVMSGEMLLEVEDRTFHLKTGDSFRFKSQTPHRFANTTTAGDRGRVDECGWVKSSVMVRTVRRSTSSFAPHSWMPAVGGP